MIQCMNFIFFLSDFMVGQKITKKKILKQLISLHLHTRECCCDKLCRWLNSAVRQHTVCLTKHFPRHSWVIVAISLLISRIYLGPALRLFSPLAVALVFVTTATPSQRTHGVSLLTGWLQLDYIFTLMETCWISVVVHSEFSIYQAGAILVSHPDIFADMFHLGTDVNVKELQMEISAL